MAITLRSQLSFCFIPYYIPIVKCTKEWGRTTIAGFGDQKTNHCPTDVYAPKPGFEPGKTA